MKKQLFNFSRMAIIFGCLLSSHILSASPVYKYIGEDGVVTYSDTPQPGSVEVDVKPIQQYSPPPASTSGKNRAANTSMPPLPNPSVEQTTYTSLIIKEPKEGDIFDSGTEVITVNGELIPDLAPTDAVQLTLDGKPSGTPQKGLVFTLPRLDRGEHTVMLSVINPVNPTQPLIQSKAVKFRQFRVSSLYPNATQQQQNVGNSVPANSGR